MSSRNRKNKQMNTKSHHHHKEEEEEDDISGDSCHSSDDDKLRDEDEECSSDEEDYSYQDESVHTDDDDVKKEFEDARRFEKEKKHNNRKKTKSYSSSSSSYDKDDIRKSKNLYDKNIVKLFTEFMNGKMLDKEKDSRKDNKHRDESEKWKNHQQKKAQQKQSQSSKKKIDTKSSSKSSNSKKQIHKRQHKEEPKEESESEEEEDQEQNESSSLPNNELHDKYSEDLYDILRGFGFDKEVIKLKGYKFNEILYLIKQADESLFISISSKAVSLRAIEKEFEINIVPPSRVFNFDALYTFQFNNQHQKQQKSDDGIDDESDNNNNGNNNIINNNSSNSRRRNKVDIFDKLKEDDIIISKCTSEDCLSTISFTSLPPEQSKRTYIKTQFDKYAPDSVKKSIKETTKDKMNLYISCLKQLGKLKFTDVDKDMNCSQIYIEPEKDNIQSILTTACIDQYNLFCIGKIEKMTNANITNPFKVDKNKIVQLQDKYDISKTDKTNIEYASAIKRYVIAYYSIINNLRFFIKDHVKQKTNEPIKKKNHHNNNRNNNRNNNTPKKEVKSSSSSSSSRNKNKQKENKKQDSPSSHKTNKRKNDRNDNNSDTSNKNNNKKRKVEEDNSDLMKESFTKLYGNDLSEYFDDYKNGKKILEELTV